MKIFTMIGMLMFFAMTACTQESAKSTESSTFGAGVEADSYISYADLMSQLAEADTVQATMKAVVSEVCQVKGCWMTLLPDAKQSDNQVMVRFKDYGFFVPKDLSGKTVVVEGEAFRTVIPVDELRHYAEDAGKSEEEINKITEPEESFAFTATGVKVLSDD